jgi:hypothetical protein
MNQDDAIGRLARQIDEARQSEQLVADSESIAAACREGAGELHRICAEFVAAVNEKLATATLELSPPAWSRATFRQPGINLFQIASEGREMQIAFEVPAQPVSTEKFLRPYILEGEIRTYNQSMLEHLDVRSTMIFLCVEKASASWQFFDWRTRRTGPVDGDLLARLMEQLFNRG